MQLFLNYKWTRTDRVTSDTTLYADWVADVITQEGITALNLGIKSSVNNKELYWAICNLGASTPWEAGGYYSMKVDKDKNVLIDKCLLGGATTDIPEGFRLPTYAEILELEKCVKGEGWSYVEKKSANGKPGTLGGLALNWNEETDTCDYFFPAAGYIKGESAGTKVTDIGQRGYCFSSGIIDDKGTTKIYDFNFCIRDKGPYVNNGPLDWAEAIRLVYEK